MDIEEINRKMAMGDKIQISKIVGCSKRTVISVLNGSRNNDTPTGRKITEVAIQIIENRIQLAEKYQNI